MSDDRSCRSAAGLQLAAARHSAAGDVCLRRPRHPLQAHILRVWQRRRQRQCDLLALAPSLRAIGLFDVLVPRDPALKDVMERRPWKQKARIAPGLVHATIETD